MGLSMTLLLNLENQELKRYFSNLPTALHAAVNLKTITQKLKESLYIFISMYS